MKFCVPNTSASRARSWQVPAKQVPTTIIAVQMVRRIRRWEAFMFCDLLKKRLLVGDSLFFQQRPGIAERIEADDVAAEAFVVENE